MGGGLDGAVDRVREGRRHEVERSAGLPTGVGRPLLMDVLSRDQ
jgi:hypothetical protein